MAFSHARKLVPVLLAIAPLPLLAAHHMAAVPVAAATRTDASGAPVGTATIETSHGKVRLGLMLDHLAPGVHGMHLHTTGSCEGPGFTSAGGHLNPGMHMHGTLNPQGAHLGDLPNVTVGPDGKLATTIDLPLAAKGLAATLFDADGTALVIHAGPDDYRTDPAGNSGARVACGVLKAPAAT